VEEAAEDHNVGQGDPLTGEEGGVLQLLVELLQHSLGFLLGSAVLLLWQDAQQWEDPGTGGRHNLVVGEGDPLLDLGLDEGALSTAQLLVGQQVSDGIGLAQELAFGSLKSGHLMIRIITHKHIDDDLALTTPKKMSNSPCHRGTS